MGGRALTHKWIGDVGSGFRLCFSFALLGFCALDDWSVDAQNIFDRSPGLLFDAQPHWAISGAS